jgi:hypothetical protein
MKPKNQHLKDLETLFEFVPPVKLKGAITRLLLSCLISGETPNKDVCEDIHFLFDFLDRSALFLEKKD